jgi:hypothetical protein
LFVGTSLGATLGATDGVLVGATVVGTLLGATVATLGAKVGAVVGSAVVGTADGDAVDTVGADDGTAVGPAVVGTLLGAVDGVAVGSAVVGVTVVCSMTIGVKSAVGDGVSFSGGGAMVGDSVVGTPEGVAVVVHTVSKSEQQSPNWLHCSSQRQIVPFEPSTAPPQNPTQLASIVGALVGAAFCRGGVMVTAVGACVVVETIGDIVGIADGVRVDGCRVDGCCVGDRVVGCSDGRCVVGASVHT